MRAIVFSDSHGDIKNCINAISNTKNIDMIFHLGDFVEDVTKLIELYPNIPFYYVAGNNDYNSPAPLQQIVNLSDNGILLTHGHNHAVKSDAQLFRLTNFALDNNVALALYGHTHIARDEFISGVHVLNPGSISLPIGDSPTYAIIDVVRGQFKTKIVQI